MRLSEGLGAGDAGGTTADDDEGGFVVGVSLGHCLGLEFGEGAGHSDVGFSIFLNYFKPRILIL